MIIFKKTLLYVYIWPLKKIDKIIIKFTLKFEKKRIQYHMHTSIYIMNLKYAMYCESKI